MEMINGKESHISEIQWLQIIFSYLRHQIDPQPTIPLDHLESLNIEDLSAITPDMFEIRKYTKEDVEDMIEALNLIILKYENREIRTENVLINLIKRFPNDGELGREIRKRYGTTT
jgi:hypothetical protein